MTEQILSEAEYDAITDAAAHWCMRLHEQDCTAAEREEFDAWLKADPLHASEYEAMLEIWDVADHLPRPPQAEVIPLPSPSSAGPGHAMAWPPAACWRFPGRLHRLEPGLDTHVLPDL